MLSMTCPALLASPAEPRWVRHFLGVTCCRRKFKVDYRRCVVKEEKRGKEEEEEEERKRDFQGKSLNHLESIFIKMALRSRSKHSLAEPGRTRDSHFLSPSHSSLAVRES